MAKGPSKQLLKGADTPLDLLVEASRFLLAS
jgi:hypothetical protein